MFPELSARKIPGRISWGKPQRLLHKGVSLKTLVSASSYSNNMTSNREDSRPPTVDSLTVELGNLVDEVDGTSSLSRFKDHLKALIAVKLKLLQVMKFSDNSIQVHSREITHLIDKQNIE